jgi:N-acetylglutamate synthase-like GNAT family acetyltransferase
MEYMFKEILIRSSIQPGDLGYLIYFHGLTYSKEYDFNYCFEGYVAESVSEFCKLNTMDGSGLWIAEKNDKIIATIGIVKNSPEEAQLRWLLVHPKHRGIGLGKELVKNTVDYCTGQGYDNVFLWTISYLEAAAHIYKLFGFRQTEQITTKLWGKVITQVRYDLHLEGV